jgi:predicted RNase H-like nuclease
MGPSIGVDWASGCWVVVAINDAESVEITTEPAFLNVWHHYRDADTILVDVPIGLSKTPSRECDEAAQDFLRDRRSSVFDIPCRRAVETRDYCKARERNGGSLGSQSWWLLPQIREVDIFLKEKEEAEESIYESHPEVCYEQFARQKDLEPVGSKQETDGIEARLEVLRAVDETFEGQIRASLDEYQEKDEWYQRIRSSRFDDILDAAVLALTGKKSSEEFAVFPEGRSTEDRCVIVYPSE